MRPYALAVVAVALFTPAPTTVSAQASRSTAPPSATATAHTVRPDPGASAAAAAADAAGPRLGASRAGISPLARAEVVTSPRPLPVVQESRRRNGQILTIIGGAIFVAGMLMDDDDVGTVVALGGLAVGVYGLIQWLQASVSYVASP